MQGTLSAIYYYPIKGLPGVAMERCQVYNGERLPFDRRYALAPAGVDFNPEDPRHVSKRELFVLMKHQRLAEIELDFSPDRQWLTLSHKGRVKVDASLDTAVGQAAVEDCVADLLGERPRLLSAPGHGFTDLSHRTVSIINLASIRDLEQALGTSIDRRRFRANLYIDGVPAWSELDWLDETVHINGVAFEVYRLTDRCAAINVDPVTAQRDRLLQALRQVRGNLDMGVYASVANEGSLAVGDAITLSD